MATVMEIPRESTKAVQDRYRCASCWNPVIIRFSRELKGDSVIVDCGTDGCNTPGLVSAKYVEKRLSVNLSEAHEAKRVLKEVIGWMQGSKQAVGKMLSELGF